MKCNYFIDIDGIYDYHCLYTFFSYRSMEIIGLVKVYFCWGSLDGICISCEVPSISDTTLGISEQYLFFCHQIGMVGH
jgi:hypothetical protein